MEKVLGKIESVKFGFGGYQDAMIGISFTLSGGGWGVGDFWGHWSIERSEYAKWQESERIEALGKMVMRIKALLSDAKKTSVNQLTGVPVEVTLEGNTLVEWRVLKEVL